MKTLKWEDLQRETVRKNNGTVGKMEGLRTVQFTNSKIEGLHCWGLYGRRVVQQRDFTVGDLYDREIIGKEDCTVGGFNGRGTIQ